MRLSRPLLALALAGGLTGLLVSPAGALLVYSSGPPPGVASEPPNYSNCTQCHTTNPVNTGSGSVTISGVPSEYTPGQTYTITVTNQRTGSSRWGFEIAVIGAGGGDIGTTTITDPVRTQKVAQGGRTWIQHTLSGTSAGVQNGPVSWSFDWTAPANPAAGTAFFYASGNCANNNLTNLGDYIYNTATASVPAGVAHADATLVLQPDTVRFRRNSNVTVRARVRDHTAAGQSVRVASRVRLPGGSFYPPTGSLLPPVTLNLAAGGLGETALTHSIPASAPLISATYEGYVLTPSLSVIDGDSFGFTVVP